MPRLTIDLSKDFDDRLTKIAKEENISKAEAMGKAFALLFAVTDNKTKDSLLAIVKENSKDGAPEILCQLVGV